MASKKPGSRCMSYLSFPSILAATSLDTLSLTSQRERDDDYHKVIVNFFPRWRMIICKDDIQMIVQKRSVSPPNTGTWAGRKYCVTLKALIRECSELGLLYKSNKRAADTSFRNEPKVVRSDKRLEKANG